MDLALRRRASDLLPTGLRLRLGAAKDRRRTEAFESHWRRGRFGTVELEVLIADPMGSLWYGDDWPTETIGLDLLRRSRLRDGLTFDCGAHHGVVAALLAQEARQVVAFEAGEHNAEVARQIAERNGIANLTVVHAAVSDHVGTARFSDRSNGSLHPEGPVTVPAVTVDQQAAIYGRPDVLFVDVEGYELAVLRGAAQVLADLPDLYLEVHVGCGLEAAGGSVAELLAVTAPWSHRWVCNDLGLDVPVALEDAPPSVLDDRFFLIATAGS